ncbi:serine O-acetyltransferase [Methylomonas koyamae]|uniref:serine O-acetyltransferase n=1 Tax=Methylomonas koyamae TaxID=702114 RepID=UPI000A43FA36|nr:hypothetical protein [Methylomonas koyamae]
MSLSDTAGGWGIDALVAELRDLRVKSLEHRQRREHPPKLPSRRILGPIVDNLGAVLFPNRLGQEDLNDEGIDYFVGQTLDSLLRQLHRQVALELRFVAEQNGTSTEVKHQAAEITREFAKQLPKIRLLIDSDIQAAFEGDPAARSSDEVLVCYPGITAAIHHRVAHELYRLGAPLVARVIAELAHSATGIDIHPGAQIADSFLSTTAPASSSARPP